MACETIRQDRISALPDCVLSHILSQLPTRDAVQTTILAKRWNNLWISVPNLDLDYYVFQLLGRRHIFEEFVDGVLSLHASSNIQKFRLGTDRGYNFDRDEHFSRISRWISDAMMHGIIELDLAIFCDFYEMGLMGGLQLPSSLFTCKTIVALKVSGNCMNLAPPPSAAAACFPALKSLDYRLHGSDTASMFEILVSKCPVLEDLTTETNVFIFATDVNTTLNIVAAELKTFRMLGHSSPQDIWSISINAPKLENLVVTVEADTSNYNFSHNGNALVKAAIHITHALGVADLKKEDDCVGRSPPLLEAVTGVKYLSLSTPRFSAHSLPSFHNLEHLEIELYFCSYWEYVMELLKRSPKLEHIVLDICTQTWGEHNYVKGYRPFSPPEVVPICVSSHLKTISINNFMGYDDEFEVVKYLLKSSEVLRRLTISTFESYLFWSRRMKPEKLHRKALKFQKCSATCEIEIIINPETNLLEYGYVSS